MVRGAVLGVKENAYFQAAQAIGSSRRRSLLCHVLPNMFGDAVRDLLGPRLRGRLGRYGTARE